MTKRTMRFWLPTIVLAFSPTVAYADAGTPIMWASAFHLVLGNAVIGVAEGLILAFLFRLKRAPCVAIMIAANYFSAWVGGVFLIPAITASLDLDLYNAWRWLWYMVAITYFFTLLLEWPFVALCLRKSDGWFRKSIWGSLVVQSASYLALFGWYWAASGTSLYTDLVVVEPSAISLPEIAMLYYIDDHDGDVYARDLGHEETRKVSELGSSGVEHTLLLRGSRTTAGRWDVIAGSETEEPSPAEIVVLADVSGTAADPPCVRIRRGGEVPRFRADKSGWQFHFGWMAGRLDGENMMNGQNIHLSLETPFVRWPVYCPTQLPSGHVIFQLGRHQICILDPDDRKVALLAKGRWPVVALKDGVK